MSIIKQKIRYDGNDMNLQINLGSFDNLFGLQQEIDSETQYESNRSINNVIDEEKRRFKLGTTDTQRIKFLFYNSSTGLYTPHFTNAGFTNNELTTKNIKVRNSFWIFDYYDDFDPNSQNKIFTQYITRIGTAPIYDINDSDDQIYYWYVPLSYINKFTGNTVNGYMKVSFFNSKTGKLILFYNSANESLHTPQKMYFECVLNLQNKTWIFNTSNYPNVIGKEILTNAYVERINDTYSKFTQKKQNPPSGNTYNYKTNTYLKT